MEIWEEHDSLFHYTTEAGAYGILESQVLHATHFRYLNDATESEVMKLWLKQRVSFHVRNFLSVVANNARGADIIASDGGIDSLVSRQADAVVENIYRVTFGIGRKYAHFQPYVVSFCTHNNSSYEHHNGLLSQWRAYGRDAGYALVFDTKALCDLIKEEHSVYHYDGSVQLCDVVYNGQKKRFNREFKTLIEAVDKVMPQFISSDDAEIGTFYSPFLSSVLRLKHQGFREEQEVRMLLSPTERALRDAIERESQGAAGSDQRRLKEVYFKNYSTPYIKIFDAIKTPLPVQRIIVGPHRDKLGRRERLMKYLELTGREIRVDCSETPLL